MRAAFTEERLGAGEWAVREPVGGRCGRMGVEGCSRHMCVGAPVQELGPPPTPHLVVLVGGDRDEVGLREHVGAEGTVGQLQDVVGSHDVEARLILVHGVQDGLRGGCGSAGSPQPLAGAFLSSGNLPLSISVSHAALLSLVYHPTAIFLLSSLLFFSFMILFILFFLSILSQLLSLSPFKNIYPVEDKNKTK